MKYYLLIALFSSMHNEIICQTKTNLIKIVADDRAEKDCFGWSTSIFGNCCVVGTPEKKAKAPFGNRLWQEGGGAYVFTKQKKGNWLQTQMLLPDRPKESDYFGTTVSMYDNYIAIGCNGDDDIDKNSDFLNRMGAVYLYKLDKLGKWNKTQKIILEKREPNDNFGYEVFLYKKKLAISSISKEFADSKFKGAVYMYEQIGAGGWVQKHIIKCPEKDVLLFGVSISMSDSLLIVGCESEKVFVYKLNMNGQWTLLKQLIKIDNSDVGFGSSVFIKNKLICIGASGSFENYIDNPDTLNYRKKNLLGAGSVYIYEIDNKNSINLNQRITAKDIKADMHFGMCMSITDSLLVVGAFGDALDIENLPDNRYGGAAYIFKQNNIGDWVETRKIVSPIRSVWDKFAFSVSAYKKTVIIGSRFEEENAQEKYPINDAGAAYIYEDK